MWDTEKHHVVPVSLGGVDAERNLMPLKKVMHKELHDVLNIPMKRYSVLQRRAKVITNGRIIKTPEGIEAWADMQREFFMDLHKLPTWLQKEHVKKMMQMMDYDYKGYQKLTGNSLDRPRRVNNVQGQFNELHEKSITAQKETAKELVKNIRYYMVNRRKMV